VTSGVPGNASSATDSPSSADTHDRLDREQSV